MITGAQVDASIDRINTCLKEGDEDAARSEELYLFRLVIERITHGWGDEITRVLALQALTAPDLVYGGVRSETSRSER